MKGRRMQEMEIDVQKGERKQSGDGDALATYEKAGTKLSIVLFPVQLQGLKVQVSTVCLRAWKSSQHQLLCQGDLDTTQQPAESSQSVGKKGDVEHFQDW
jgi:hypothetical protein